MMRTKLIAAASFLALSACSGSEQTPSQSGGAIAGCDTRAYAEIGGPIELIDTNGDILTEADFKGRPSLVYFGFTYCPDICPSTLVTIDRALKRLPDSVTPPRTILISIDPERDTPEALGAYINTPAFPDDIVGLTGSEKSVKAAADAFKTAYSRIETPDSLAEYTMDHPSIVYLMDADWTLETFFTHDATDSGMADCLAQKLS